MKSTRLDMLRVIAAPLMVLAVLFGIPGHSAVGSTYSAATATGGTILFQRQNHWYTIAPNGTHLHMLLSTTAGCTGGGCGAFSPDGTRIMVAAASLDKKRITVAVLNTDGTGYHRLPLPDRTLNIEPGIWLPLGNRIAVHGWDNTNKKRDGIYELGASDGSGFKRVATTPDRHAEVPLAFSPDGARLAIFREHPVPAQEGGFGDLMVASADGTGIVQLNSSGTRVWNAFGSLGNWSPDGKQIVFTAYDLPVSGASAVFVADANGSHRRRITSWGTWITSARWSPNGTWIVFSNLAPGASAHNLFLVHPNGTGLKEITSYPLDGACCAVWSPDGKKLLTDRQHDRYLITMNWDGTGVKTLTHAAKDVSAGYVWGR